MKTLLITLSVLVAFLLTPFLVNAQIEQSSTTRPPLSQPLIREGTLAMKLAETLKVGTPTNETEAESALTAIGIAPRNGWIGDYPVTPDIAVELQTSVSEAAQSGRLTMEKDMALRKVQDVLTEYNLSVTRGVPGQGSGETSAPTYPDSTVIDNYYYDQGPPVVTYYAPPPDYGYLYTWVPYPFWWWDFWYPGFFVLADFDIHGHGHGHDHHFGHGRDEFISNHFRDSNTGRMSRIDPVNRVHGGTFADGRGTRWSNPSAQRGAAAIFNRSSSFTVRGNNGTLVSSRNGSSISRFTDRSQVLGGRTYGSSSFYSGRGFSQPSYRARTFSSPTFSTGSRSYSVPSAGGRGSGYYGGSRGSFGGSRGSFGGGRR